MPTAETDRELDVRTLPPADRSAAILATFDRLSPGDAFVLVDERDPRPFLRTLHAERGTGFHWAVLERGPERQRVEIRRRDDERTPSVAEYLEGDHRRLDAFVPEVEHLVAAESFAAAHERFATFACGLSQHIDAEEQVLFPAFEEMTGMTSGPTLVMRSEHVEIRRQMTAVESALARADAVGVAVAMRALTGVLTSHNAKEEQVLYPITDRAAGSDGAREDLVRRIQAS